MNSKSDKVSHRKILSLPMLLPLPYVRIFSPALTRILFPFSSTAVSNSGSTGTLRSRMIAIVYKFTITAHIFIMITTLQAILWYNKEYYPLCIILLLILSSPVMPYGIMLFICS